MNLIQFLVEGIKIAFTAIGANRLRAFLTMLGVATGIFAIVGILTMVNSMQTSITKNLSALGNTTIFVHHWPWQDNRNDWYKFINRPKVSYRDFQKLKQNLTGVEGVCYEVSVRGQLVRAEGRSISNVELVGSTSDMSKVRDLSFLYGRYFSEIEHHLGNPVCIIGYNIAQNLFPDQDPSGKFIRISGKRLMVTGVLTKVGSTMFFGAASEDDKVFIPYSVLPKMFNLNTRAAEKVITIKASHYEDLPYVESETIGLIRAARGLRPQMEDNFAINKQEALMSQFETMFGYLETGGWFISLFSILIGGFSIGNIMYISVRERTREIGIQKALGATKGFVLYQFIMEAVLICFFGGLIGLGMVFGIGGLIQSIMTAMDLPMQVSFALGDLMTGIGLSVFTGLASGIIPATLAASLDPVTAIRQV
ncbi:MAG: ABC transporter permease [Bacteroidia bacterium]|nr:ABC transporter permease [Bacteroidia bacterium]